jgi:hypothetical protein
MVELGRVQDLKLHLQQMAVIHVVAQQQRQKFAALMHAQVVKYQKLCQNEFKIKFSIGF